MRAIRLPQLRHHALGAVLVPWRAIRAWYLRKLISATERDIFWAEQDLERLPAQIEVYRRHLSALGVQLIDAQGN